MKFFVTGATGYIGQHIVDYLLAHKHDVISLTRRVPIITDRQVTWITGDVARPETYENYLNDVDYIIHLAMEDENAKCQSVDKVAVETFLRSKTPLIYASNLFTSADTDNSDLLIEEPIYKAIHWRNSHENLVLNYDANAVLRLGFVFGGSGGYLWETFQPNSSGHILWSGKKANRWPFIHIEDLNELVLKIVDNKGNGVFHACCSELLEVEQLVHLVGDLQGGIPHRVSFDIASAHYGIFAEYMLKDINAANNRSYSIGWSPKHKDISQAVKVSFSQKKQDFA